MQDVGEGLLQGLLTLVLVLIFTEVRTNCVQQILALEGPSDWEGDNFSFLKYKFIYVKIK